MTSHTNDDGRVISHSYIHYRYWLLILGLVGIGLASLAFAQVPGIAAYLTFALTIGSLLLSALAIVYAFVSNASIAQNLAALQGASTDLSAAAKTVQDATGQLAEQIQVMPGELGGKVDRAIALAESQASFGQTVATRLESIAHLVSVTQAAPAGPNTKPQMSAHDMAVAVLNGAGPLLQIAMYAMVVASERDISSEETHAVFRESIKKTSGKAWMVRYAGMIGVLATTRAFLRAIGLESTIDGKTTIAPELVQQKTELLSRYETKPLDWFPLGDILAAIEASAGAGSAAPPGLVPSGAGTGSNSADVPQA